MDTIIKKYILEHSDEEFDICYVEYPDDDECHILCAELSLLSKAVYLTKQIPELNNLIEKYVKFNPEKINALESDGSTALMRAANFSKNNSTEQTVRILLNAGADPNIQNNSGYTALMYAAWYSRELSSSNTVQMLVSSNANQNVVNIDGLTAFEIAKFHSETESTNQTLQILTRKK